ncbi:cation diffusion facilitator family transporter [Paenibacillus radicis (ex Xue et al. 2023)]|uniref:Cation diffusion facilitator family transporter n=1 Tax=Paenibacillus radicis (ex Xue et al. 2023) TaxID=2972489 RepID=A0ABT1YAB0_9BACL|nr:cation diffusion facilitator family transporter [Paenibacillus radicis (ex Xue et al. 2023)]MCR8630129.1 cation diffusion facilitator family transporter [Paenibacillus radicis (ex Xue et al. 2023)]
MSREDKQSAFAIWISLISNIVLTCIKFSVGLLFNSPVLIADGVHNAGDVVATGAALSSMRVSKQPPDEDHPYGHGKAEVVGAGIVAIILGMAGIYMGYHSVKVLFEPPHNASVIALVAAAFSLILKQVLYVYTMSIGKKMKSNGLIATAYDHLADVYASIAAVIGIGLAMVGDYYNITFLSYGDPIAGIVVAFFVLKLAVHMGKASVGVLMEKNVDSEKLNAYINLVQSVPEVKRIDRIRARDHGHYIIIDVRVGIPAELTIQNGHDISRHIKETIMNQHPDVEEVLVHLNPWYKENG